ncbi:uncharacterized protein LOC110442722 isoform X2 [Mizuhopecten yessoensis]|uniref:uncharacterized protein LOC110442722 isoform X2 n=1 Tax=Mizuhopecten yessoensis TaxID=6573 RepID=UPI000B45F42C|nr:uncharacterized protein LOC110442722 isoform X2 [Mizuhopecten yessoensis]
MEETPKSLIEGFIQTAQTHHTVVPKRWRHALTRTPDKLPSPGVGTRSATKRKQSDLPEKTPRTMIETYMTNAKTELLSTSRTRRRRSFPAAPVNVTADNFTPRTNIAKLIEQGEEETPYIRPRTRRSSRKSLPALPVNDTIQLLPMSPSIEEEQSRMNSTLRSSRRSNAASTRGNTIAESVRKRKRQSSTRSVTNQTLEDIDDSIHLLPDSSSGDEAMETADNRKQSPMRNSQRSKLPSSSQMFNFKEVLSTYEETEQERDNINTDDNLSEKVLPPSSPEKETSSKSSPMKIPETQEIHDSQNRTAIDHRIHRSSIYIPETQEDSMAGESETQEDIVAGESETLESSPLRPLPSSQSEDGAEADNEDEEDEGSQSILLHKDQTSTEKDVNKGGRRRSLFGNRTYSGNDVSEKDERKSLPRDQPSTQSDVIEGGRRRSLPRDRSSSGNDLGEKVLRRSLHRDQTSSEDNVIEKDGRKSMHSDKASKHANVSGNAIENAGSDHNQQRTFAPEMISSVKPFDYTENEQNNSIFDKSTSLVGMEDRDDTSVRGNTYKGLAHASSTAEDMDLAHPSSTAEDMGLAHASSTAEDMDLAHPSTTAEDMDLAHPSSTAEDMDLAHPSTTAEDKQGSDEEASVHEVEEEEGQNLEEEGQMEADFVLDEESAHVEEEEPLDKDADVENQSDEEDEEMTEEVTEDVTENYRLAKTPHLATPQDSQRPAVRPLTDVLKSRNSALPLRSVNEVLKDRGNTTPPKSKEKEVKITQRKTKAKTRQSAPLPVSVIKKVFGHYCKMKVSSDVLPGLINATEKFFRQVPADIEAYCHHAGRKTIDETDVELLMMRQRLIKDNKSLNVLIEENLPLEYRLQLIPIARSGNIVYPK